MKIQFTTQHPWFKRIILSTLNGPHSWGVYVEEVKKYQTPDVIVGINNKREFSKIINKRRIYFSATIMSTPPVILFDPINFIYGVSRSKLTPDEYREYVINHEFGHVLGQQHVRCDRNKICPIMYQMTRGIPHRSIANSRVLNHEKAKLKK